MKPRDRAELNEAMGSALCDVLAVEGDMVTKWVTVAEVIDQNGQRWLRTMTNEGAAVWDTLGMLGHALADEQATVAAYNSESE